MRFMKMKISKPPRRNLRKSASKSNYNKKNTNSGNKFWMKEYEKGDHFSLSEREGATLVKFMRYLRREEDHLDLSEMNFLDIGCGNGRNSVYLAREFGMKGAGFDLVGSAIDSAKKLGRDLPIRFYVHNLASPSIPEEDNSCDLILDMMVSHCLQKTEREQYKKEINRILRLDGFMFVKTFLREGDQHAKRMIEKRPGADLGSYVHPTIGVYEYVWTERDFLEFWGDDFIVRLFHKSHGYQRWGGQPYKRRYLTAYLQKK